MRVRLPPSALACALCIRGVVGQASAGASMQNCGTVANGFRMYGAATDLGYPEGSLQDRPCPNAGSAAASGDWRLYICSGKGAVLCDGDPDSSSPATCNYKGKIGCDQATNPGGGDLGITQAHFGPNSVYLSCVWRVAWCQFDTAAGSFSNCKIIANAECPGSNQNAHAEYGLTTIPSAPTKLAVSCASHGVLMCTLNAPGSGTLSGACSVQGTKPCSDTHRGLSIDSTGKLIAVCNSDNYRYCDFSPSTGPSACSGSGIGTVPGSQTALRNIVELRPGLTAVMGGTDPVLFCQSPDPTRAPTWSPTPMPTSFPTSAPTRSPTRDPTAAPTGSPTTAPSRPPSGAPTRSPSRSPSASPTGAPSRAPSGSPTAAPVNPTARPSAAPSVSPSAAPTAAPSGSPSAAPSGWPTAAPSASAPSASPSVSPLQPTELPSAAPAHPTDRPTAPPSAAPSGQPSAAPSPSPSSSPTGSPWSSAPSQAPTQPPSSHPSTAPSWSPSAAPTAPPSEPPSQWPTPSPTSSPSWVPTGGPTAMPTWAPSVPPTLSPTQRPSLSPTLSPTEPPARPTRAPSAPPSQRPTPLPSSAPSAAPSRSPSVQPTPAPSGWPSQSPTFGPSLSPSNEPSAGPSTPPSPSPSAPPTLAPSIGPTVAPSQEPSAPPAPPSGGPSAAPTRMPSAAPAVPSAAPSQSPSAAPSAPPQGTPSLPPTVHPSAPPQVPPTLAPISLPTVSPSGAPSAPPTGAPSLAPVRPPSASPTVPPSLLPTQPPAGPTGAPISPTAAPVPQPTGAPAAAVVPPPSGQPSLPPSASPVQTVHVHVTWLVPTAEHLRSDSLVELASLLLSDKPPGGGARRRALPLAAEPRFAARTVAGLTYAGDTAERAAVGVLSDVPPEQWKWNSRYEGLPAAAAAGEANVTAAVSADGQALSVRVVGRGYRLRAPHTETLSLHLGPEAFADNASYTAWCQSTDPPCAALELGTLDGETPRHVPQVAQQVMEQGEVAAVAAATSGTVLSAVAGGGSAAGNLARLAMVQRVLSCPAPQGGDPQALPMSINPLQMAFGHLGNPVRYARGTVVGDTIILSIALLGISTGLWLQRVRWQRRCEHARKQGKHLPKHSLRTMLIQARVGWLLVPVSFIYGGVIVAVIIMYTNGDTGGYLLLGSINLLIFTVGLLYYVATAAKRAPSYTTWVSLPEEDRPKGWRWAIWGSSEWQPNPEVRSTYKSLAQHHLVFDGYRGGIFRYTFTFELVYSLILATVAAWSPASLDECKVQGILLSIFPLLWTAYIGGLRPYIAPYENALDSLIAASEGVMVCIATAGLFADPDSWHDEATGVCGMIATWTVTVKSIMDLTIFMVDEYMLYDEHIGGKADCINFTRWVVCCQGKITHECGSGCFSCRMALGQEDVLSSSDDDDDDQGIDPSLRRFRKITEGEVHSPILGRGSFQALRDDEEMDVRRGSAPTLAVELEVVSPDATIATEPPDAVEGPSRFSSEDLGFGSSLEQGVRGRGGRFSVFSNRIGSPRRSYGGPLSSLSGGRSPSPSGRSSGPSEGTGGDLGDSTGQLTASVLSGTRHGSRWGRPTAATPQAGSRPRPSQMWPRQLSPPAGRGVRTGSPPPGKLKGSDGPSRPGRQSVAAVSPGDVSVRAARGPVGVPRRVSGSAAWAPRYASSGASIPKDVGFI
eukprot:TRINITY_DN8904_c0_g1_i2.p1 TRINITY_DN8904_c0_g1~~TRINITY_DN8904_c0_g1_i2.p1  ORF type:complete len:1670 (+),score=229.75 TRINITY_DN8904_c0_g1_i2:95-5104(+)